jgi:peroxiredoxin Q/BCP
MRVMSGCDLIDVRAGAMFKDGPDEARNPLASPPAPPIFGPASNTLMAKAPELTLKEGDPAPAFTAATNGGGAASLSDFRGKQVVLYFYPRDDTPGCTKEACAFRDSFADFRKKGAVVLGVSIDPVKAHDKFVEKFKLPFTLLADEERRIVEAYGVWGQKSFMGRKYMGVHRVTFLIGPDGRIKKIWPTVKPEDHAREVLAAL